MRPKSLADILIAFARALMAVAFAPFRLLFGAMAPPPRPAVAQVADDVARDVAEAEARVERVVAPEPEPLAVLARHYLAGEHTADISRLPLRQRAWLTAARWQRLNVVGLTNQQLERQIRGHAGGDDLVDSAVLARVRAAHKGQRAPEVIRTPEPPSGWWDPPTAMRAF